MPSNSGLPLEFGLNGAVSLLVQTAKKLVFRNQ